jgi:hypothetical protein
MNLRIRRLHPLSTAVMALSLIAAAAPPSARASEPQRGIEQTLSTAQQEKKGVTLLVGGQQLGGGVTRIEPGKWVEMRNQQHGRIVVRIDRIDAVLMP